MRPAPVLAAALAMVALCVCGSVEVPRLCVVSEGALEDCPAAPVLLTDVPLLVVHQLPAGVDPAGAQVELVVRAASVEARQVLPYTSPGQADGGLGPARALALFPFPADGGCVVVVTAQALDIHQEVTATVDGCQ